MIEKKQINISLRHNLLIGIITGIWLFLFLFLIKPFKQEKLDIIQLFYIAISMCLVTIFCYFIIIIIQNKLYKKFNKWSLKYEIIIISLFLLLTLIGNFTIYKSGITKGSYNLIAFFKNNFLPSVIILLPIIIFLRIHFFKLSNKKIIFKDMKQQFISIIGDNKLDFLKINKNDLISVASAQNYVEISFLIKNELHKKMIRSSLKKVHSDLSFLVKVHRTHLINTTHFISFKDKKTLLLTKKEIPFSTRFKNDIIAD